MTVTWTHPSRRKVAIENFISKTLPQFITDHEFHLRENGSNGHYVGDKSELLRKVQAKVHVHPEIAAWRASAQWNNLARATLHAYECTAPPSED
ncbi:hypothetical protein BG000_007497 [Podila horticola]|nr:hypothetical protein BG000_007497 [Podila horticola]